MANVVVEQRTGVNLAVVMARRGVVGGAVGAALDLPAPDGSITAVNGTFRLVGTGPESWLAVDESSAAAWPDRLSTALEGVASVSDQSGAYCLLRITGSGARELLQRGVHLDLHPSVFGPGSAAATMIAHISVILWQVDDTPTFEVAVFRSYLTSFLSWVDVASASL